MLGTATYTDSGIMSGNPKVNEIRTDPQLKELLKSRGFKFPYSLQPTVWIVTQVIRNTPENADVIIRAVDTDADLAEAHKEYLQKHNSFSDVTFYVESVSCNHLFADAMKRREKK
jgi:hypothetical protein